MQKKLLLDEISVVEALDSLTSMAELDFQLVKRLKEASRRGEVVSYASKWLDIHNDQSTLDNIKKTFEVLLIYLKEVGGKDREKIKMDETQKGIRAMIVLLDEAALKIDRYTDLMEKGIVERSIKELKEFQQLKEIYHKKLIKKLQKSQDEKEIWLSGIEEEILPQAHVDERGIKDLQAIKDDTQYELFFIKREDGKRFFNRNILRHVKLVHDFDKVVLSSLTEDPFLMAEKVKDRSCHVMAKEIKGKAHSHLHELFKKDSEAYSSELHTRMTSVVYSLCLAASYHNLLEEGAKKSCLEYLSNFISFLKESFFSTDYHANKELDYEAMSRLEKELMIILDQVCYAFFTVICAKDQMIGLINELMDERGKGEGEKKIYPRELWARILEGSFHLQRVLEKYPNGPLFKLLDAIQENENIGFDPLLQNYYPSSLYELKIDNRPIEILKCPSPTSQQYIHEARLSVLFEGFLSALIRRSQGEKLLIINLQDRTSWQEQARCHVLENLQNLAVFKDVVDVYTLAKDTSFYHQIEEYEGINDAHDFKKILQMQIANGEDCGYYFPSSVDRKTFMEFVNEIIDDIHKSFFASKKSLTPKNRRDFIEIFYQFLLLRVFDMSNPTHVCFVCKDGVDESAAQSALFYGFIKLLSQDSEFSQEEIDFFTWMLHSPALVSRERSIHQNRLERAVESLEVLSAELEVNKETILSVFQKHFGNGIIKNLSVNETKSAA